MPKTPEPKEILEKTLKTKDVYFYIDEDIKVKSREIFKNKLKEVRYPFSVKRGGEQKYRFIKKIIIENVSTKDLKGLLNNYKSGYGFTSNMIPLIEFIENNFPKIREILISGNGRTELYKKRFIINKKNYNDLFSRIRPIKDSQRKRIRSLVINFFSDNTKIKAKRYRDIYSKGALAAYIKEINEIGAELSKEDAAEVIGLASEKIGGGEIRREIVLKTKREIDEVYIDLVLEQYDSYLKQKNETKKLENKWQDFFKEHSWIFSLLFAHSMVLFQDQAYVGGQRIDRKGGRYADFIYKNNLNDNVAIIEIKTHLTPLLNKRLYRRASGIYSVSQRLSGGLIQVMDQKDVLLKEWRNVTKENFVPFEPKCLVIAGMLKTLTKDEQMKSFDLFRNNLRNVEIVTFDELRDKTQIILNLLKKKKNKE